ncbi:MAG TPA: YfaZ family outer membrane protein [Gammaproteobacteria bacterium]
MSYKILLASMLSFGMAATAQARGLDISIGDEAAQLTYLYNSDGQIGIGGTDLGMGFFFNENDDVVINGGILVTGTSAGQNRALQMGVGVRAHVGKLDIPGEDDGVSAIAIGGKIAYILPSRMPLALSLEGYIAPEVTAFGDNKDLTELLARFEIEIAPTTRFFVGFRNLEVEFEDSGLEYEIDDSGHLGIRFSF